MIERGISGKPSTFLWAPPPAASGANRPALAGMLLVALSLAFLFAPPMLLDPSLESRSDQFWLGLFAKYMALAILALSISLIWGQTGLLTLGQGLFFGLGAYMAAYSLTLKKAAAAAEVPVGIAPPQFMQYTGPAPNDPSFVVPPALQIIAPLGNIWVALAMAVLLPTVVAALFGLVTFRLRIRGVYFSLVTQMLLLVAFILVRNQQRFTGGVVGIKDLAQLRLFDVVFAPGRLLDPGTGRPVRGDNGLFDYTPIRNLNLLAAGLLVVSFLFCVFLMRTKFGRILTAIRDNENRVLALGYNTALYKTFLFAIAGGLAGLAGWLYVAANWVCGSQYLSVAFSIEAVVWVAVGGRESLLGAVVGALLVGFGQSYISSAFPDHWPIILGALFVVVVLFLPRGLTAVAGRGALLGVVAGAVSVNYLEQILGLTKAQRALLALPVILLGVFLPRLLALPVELAMRRIRKKGKAPATVSAAVPLKEVPAS
jgi:urea transport system permease protein